MDVRSCPPCRPKLSAEPRNLGAAFPLPWGWYAHSGPSDHHENWSSSACHMAARSLAVEPTLTCPRLHLRRITPDDDLGLLPSHWLIARLATGCLWACFKLTQPAPKLGTREPGMQPFQSREPSSPSIPPSSFCFWKAELNPEATLSHPHPKSASAPQGRE